MTTKAIFEQLSNNPHLGVQNLQSAVALPETFLLMFPRTTEHRCEVAVSWDTQFTLHFSNSSLFLRYSDSHLSYSGLFLLELTEPQDANSRLIVELLIKGVEKLRMFPKAGT